MIFFLPQKGSQKGFSVVELLIVVSIIGVLTLVAFTNFQKNRANSRDVRRTSDLTTVQEAIELYYDDRGYYPACTGANVSYCAVNPTFLTSSNVGNICVCTNPSTKTSNHGNFSAILDIAPQYIRTIPSDPVNSSTNFYVYMRGYKKVSDSNVQQTGLSSDYILATNRERESCSSVPCATVDALGTSWTFNTILGN